MMNRSAVNCVALDWLDEVLTEHPPNRGLPLNS